MKKNVVFKGTEKEIQHLNEMWAAKTVNGLKVVDRKVRYGRLPDIKLLLEDGSWVFASDEYNG
jgi:hypothetical protein